MNNQALLIESSAFRNNGSIPEKYTCDGDGINPPLNIHNIPEDAKSLVLIMDDPDAPIGTFVHWVAWNIPPSTKEISKGTEPSGNLGMTGFRRVGYGGPCPPSGIHRYFFKLYALDDILSLSQGSTKKEVLEAMEGHIMMEYEFMGKYEKGRGY